MPSGGAAAEAEAVVHEIAAFGGAGSATSGVNATVVECTTTEHADGQPSGTGAAIDPLTDIATQVVDPCGIITIEGPPVAGHVNADEAPAAAPPPTP
jgi:hypothetical protein